MKPFRLLFFILPLISLCLPMLRASSSPAEVAQKFKEALKTVDRLVLVQTDWDKPKEKEQGTTILVIKGADVIATLGETIEIGKFDMTCLCLESPELHFYKGENYRFSMTLHHSHRLRGNDAVWGGDAVLTEASAAQFRAWFAEHGYTGFSKSYEAGLQRMAEMKERQEKFLRLFPETVRNLFPTETDQYDRRIYKQNIAKFAAAFPDKTAATLACWRGLGEQPTAHNGASWESRHQDFLRSILNTFEVADLRSAMNHLPSQQDQVWVGAFRHYSQPRFYLDEDRMTDVVSAEWLVRLAKRIRPLTSISEQKTILSSLAKRPSDETNLLLQEIAGSGLIAWKTIYDDGSPRLFPELSMAVQAVLALAKNRIAGVRPIIARRMAEVSDPELKLALEVALAQFDGPTGISLDHLQSKIDEVAIMAWDAVSQDPKVSVPLESLAMLAEKAGSYRVRRMAEEKLQARGLRVMTGNEKARAVLEDAAFKSAENLEEVDLAIARYQQTYAGRKADKVERLVLASLSHRKGLLLLKEGKYDLAAPLLQGGFGDAKLHADQAFALQTLGKYSDAWAGISGLVDREELEAIAKQQAQFGYWAFAQGQFSEADEKFTTAVSLGGTLYKDGPLSLMRYLSQLLAGNETRMATVVLADLAVLGEPIKEADVGWPESGSLYLEGKLSESEVFARIEQQRGRKETDLCEAHLFFSALCRAKGDAAGERKHLESALATRAYTNQCFSLATVRQRELQAKATVDPIAVPASR